MKAYLAESEVDEVFTRPQRSLPARIAGLMVRMRAELCVGVVALLAWLWLVDRMPAWIAGRHRHDRTNGRSSGLNRLIGRSRGRPAADVVGVER
ncbi:MAG: hypothetical protein AB7I38_16385 [Dehalococcoidia bacterium]